MQWKKARKEQYHSSHPTSSEALVATLKGPLPISISWLSGLALKRDPAFANLNLIL